MTKLCTVCNEPIPDGRLKALPNANTCVAHSNTSTYKVNTVTVGNIEKDEHYNDIEIIRDPRTQEELEHYRKQQGTYN